jgi:hypothetical protein
VGDRKRLDKVGERCEAVVVVIVVVGSGVLTSMYPVVSAICDVYVYFGTHETWMILIGHGGLL